MYASLPKRAHNLDTQVFSVSISEPSRANQQYQELTLSFFWYYGVRNCHVHKYTLGFRQYEDLDGARRSPECMRSGSMQATVHR